MKVKLQKLSTIISFNYLGAVVSDDCSNRKFIQEFYTPLLLLLHGRNQVKEITAYSLDER